MIKCHKCGAEVAKGKEFIINNKPHCNKCASWKNTAIKK